MIIVNLSMSLHSLVLINHHSLNTETTGRKTYDFLPNVSLRLKIKNMKINFYNFTLFIYLVFFVDVINNQTFVPCVSLFNSIFPSSFKEDERRIISSGNLRFDNFLPFMCISFFSQSICLKKFCLKYI